MRHGKKFNHLSRTAPHRKAMLSNMASSLIQHKRISTTVAKAKALRKYVEPLITKAKDDSTHSRRIVFSYLQNKESITELFGDVAGKVANRPGGYTRIIRTGSRLGDNAEMCIIELVDYNENLLQDAAPAKKAKRSRRSGKKKVEETGAEEAVVSAEVTDEAEVVEEPTAEVEEVVAEAEEVAEEPVAEAEVETPAAATEEAPEASSEDETPSEDSEEEKKD
jgi:large subunit ribosomal protein L17